MDQRLERRAEALSGPLQRLQRSALCLAGELYEHILSVIRAAGRAMSRAPSTYTGWGEEDRRQSFLLMLNRHYACQS